MLWLVQNFFYWIFILCCSPEGQDGSLERWNSRRTSVLWHFQGFFCNEKDRLTLRFIFVVFRCGGAKEIVGKPQKRGKANCSCRLWNLNVERSITWFFYSTALFRFAQRYTTWFYSILQSCVGKSCMFMFPWQCLVKKIEMLVFLKMLTCFVDSQVKQLMEEAVTRKFIHADSSSITSLCGKKYCICFRHYFAGWRKIFKVVKTLVVFL